VIIVAAAVNYLMLIISISPRRAASSDERVATAIYGRHAIATIFSFRASSPRRASIASTAGDFGMIYDCKYIAPHTFMRQRWLRSATFAYGYAGESLFLAENKASLWQHA